MKSGILLIFSAYSTKLLTSVNYFHAPLEASISAVGVYFNSTVSNLKCEVLTKASSLYSYCVVCTLVYIVWCVPWCILSKVSEEVLLPSSGWKGGGKKE